MYEDKECDEDFLVESSRDFLEGLDDDEREFLYNGSGMKVCPNCGEFVSNLYGGVCNLCSKSEEHATHRHQASGDNLNADIDFIRQFNAR